MVKYLPIVLVMIVMISGLLYLRFRQTPTPKSQGTTQTATTQDTSPKQPVSTLSLEQRVKILEDSVVLIAKKIGGSAGQQILDKTTTTTSSDFKIKNLEDTVASLQQQIDVLKQTSTPTQTVGKTTVYIPLGSGGSSTDSNWTTMEAYQVSLDGADFPGYTSMQLEITGKLIQSAGTGYGRLYNSSDSQAVASSDVSTTSDQYVLLTSSGFKLSSGRKTYKLQIKTSNNFEFYIQTARIKVNF